jgi:hypothetical protein
LANDGDELCSKRAVTVSKDGKMVEHLVDECDIWHFFGESMSKGKKNAKFVADKTDNCAGQYKCKQNFYKVGTFGERHDVVAQIHLFAQKYCFKGI